MSPDLLNDKPVEYGEPKSASYCKKYGHSTTTLRMLSVNFPIFSRNYLLPPRYLQQIILENFKLFLMWL